MDYVFGLIALVFLLDAVRLRRRVSAIPVFDNVTSEDPADYSLLETGRVAFDDRRMAALSQYAQDEGWAAIDILPQRISTLDALLYGQFFDPALAREMSFQAGHTGGFGILASFELADKAGLKLGADLTPEELLRAARNIKQHSPDYSAVLVPTNDEPQIDYLDGEGLRRNLGKAFSIYAAVTPLALLLLMWGVFTSPAWGALALATYHFQPFIALFGGPVKSPDLLLVTAFRWPIEGARWFWAVVAQVNDQTRAASVEGKRPQYRRWLSQGTAGFFEEQRLSCSACDSNRLAAVITTKDIYQHKPGRFHLDRCEDCGLVFQNPRLTEAGLKFYYADFYEGLGEEVMNTVFGANREPYTARARMVKNVTHPAKWLDVGGGHGHFCAVAKREFGGTEFHLLDLADSVEETLNRGWADRGFQGAFPEIVDLVDSPYDVVSMHHYLEHVRALDVEVEAAAQVLRDDGYLMIEVPDPGSKLGRFLGRFWIAWFQPQHLNLLPSRNLVDLLSTQGFRVIKIHHGEAHTPVDFFFAAFILLSSIAPTPDVPWSERPGRLSHAVRRGVWALGSPLLVLGMLMDRLMLPFTRREGWSNTYRVLAQKAVKAAPKNSGEATGENAPADESPAEDPAV